MNTNNNNSNNPLEEQPVTSDELKLILEQALELVKASLIKTIKMIDPQRLTQLNPFQLIAKTAEFHSEELIKMRNRLSPEVLKALVDEAKASLRNRN